MIKYLSRMSWREFAARRVVTIIGGVALYHVGAIGWDQLSRSQQAEPIKVQCSRTDGQSMASRTCAVGLIDLISNFDTFYEAPSTAFKVTGYVRLEEIDLTPDPAGQVFASFRLYQTPERTGKYITLQYKARPGEGGFFNDDYLRNNEILYYSGTSAEVSAIGLVGGTKEHPVLIVEKSHQNGTYGVLKSA